MVGRKITDLVKTGKGHFKLHRKLVQLKEKYFETNRVLGRSRDGRHIIAEESTAVACRADAVVIQGLNEGHEQLL